MTKRFALAPSEIKSLTEGRGSCIASDRITVDAQRVGYMYRELPEDELDSGWRFFSGDEVREYIDEPGNFGLYDVNTIANYDPEIIAHLDAPPLSAFERRSDTSGFVTLPLPSVVEEA